MTPEVKLIRPRSEPRNPKSGTTFYEWEGDACRLHVQTNGAMTADIYRGGKGILPISIMEIFFCSAQISEARYKKLVKEENEVYEVRRQR